MEIPECPPDIQNIDEGFNSLSKKPHDEKEHNSHKKNTLQAIDDQRDYLASQLQTPNVSKDDEFFFPVKTHGSDACPECTKTYKSANGKFCSYCGYDRGTSDKKSLLLAMSENTFNCQHLFVYNNLWKLKDKSSIPEINLFNKKMQFLTNFIQ
jgi:hypothetical protein